MRSIALIALAALAACSSTKHDDAFNERVVQPEDAGSCVDCDAQAGETSSPDGSTPAQDAGSSNDSSPPSTETDIGCGGPTAPRCSEGKHCLVDSDCTVACGYAKRCVSTPSCAVHMGGDTCGAGEDCCRTLPVVGFPAPAGKVAHLDKYEITAGRVRAFLASVTTQMGGKPNVRGWINLNKPVYWNDAWSAFLPTNTSGDMMTINRLLLGDPRHDGELNPGPGVIVPPAVDGTVDLGTDFQFGAQVYADVHGNNCGLFAGSYGFPTFYYPANILTHNNEVPRASELKDVLDAKSMNCITNVMLAAFCEWDGGQLATEEIMNFVTDSPVRDISVSGCGTQHDDHGELLGNVFTNTVQAGGRCPAVNQVIATFDAGENLPVPGSPLNSHLYWFPASLVASTSDKSWQIASPGQIAADAVRISPGDEPWMDMAGNLSEAVLDGTRFGLKFRGVGYGSARSDLNTQLMPGETIPRLRRPEVKSALSGGRCMRFK